jgi:acetyl esterase/lipase
VSKLFLASLAGAALCLSASVPLTAQTAVTAPLPRVEMAVFAQAPFMQSLQLSPDGTKAVLRVGIKGDEHLGYLDLTKPGSKPVLFASNTEFREVGDRTVSSFRWVGNKHIVFTLVSRENIFGDKRQNIQRMVDYSLETGKITPLAWDGALQHGSILQIDHDKGTFLLERTSDRYPRERWDNPEVLKVDVNTGKFEIVQMPNPVISDWYADSKGVVRAGAGYDPDTGKARLLYRSNASGTFRTVENAADKDFTGANITPSIFLDVPDMVIVESNKDGFRKVYKVNMATMELGKPIFSVRGYDVDGALPNRKRDGYVGFVVTDKRARQVWTDGDLATVQKYMEETFGKGNVFITSWDEKLTRFIIHVGGPDQAGAYYLFNGETGDTKLIGWRDESLKDAHMNPVSTVRYKASDGMEIEAVVTMPRHRKQTKGLPLVIITHGGPFGVRDSESWDTWSQSIAELGYVVIQPNYRGSGGYGSAFLKAGRAEGFGLRMQDDLNDAITYLASTGLVDPKRVCMMGWSYGGYASARAAQRDADKYRCTIAGAGVYDLQLMKQYDKEYLGQFGANYLAKGAADLDTVSPARNAIGTWAPIMIVHGVRDDRVPIAQARTLVSALRGAGKRQGIDFDFVEQPKNTHNLPYADVRLEWFNAAQRWLDKYNPAYIATDTDKPVPIGVLLK